MLPRSRQPIHVLMAALLAFALPQAVLSQTPAHIVSPLELQKAEQNATQTRQQHMDSLKGFLGSADARKALEKAHMDPVQVQNAIAGLNDQELAQLATRANKAQSEFAAGSLSNNDLLLILVFFAALILIIVAVKS
ncbi:MAG: PA2779 family protein [Terracidiphilus sp.]